MALLYEVSVFVAREGEGKGLQVGFGSREGLLVG